MLGWHCYYQIGDSFAKEVATDALSTLPASTYENLFKFREKSRTSLEIFITFPDFIILK